MKRIKFVVRVYNEDHFCLGKTCWKCFLKLNFEKQRKMDDIVDTELEEIFGKKGINDYSVE